MSNQPSSLGCKEKTVTNLKNGRNHRNHQKAAIFVKNLKCNIFQVFWRFFFFNPGKKSCTIVFMRGMKDNYLYSWKKRKPYFAIPSENLEGHFHETLYRMSLGSVFVFAKIIICFSELISFSRNSRNLIFFNHGGTSSTKSLSRYICPKFYWGLAFHLFTFWKCFIAIYLLDKLWPTVGYSRFTSIVIIPYRYMYRWFIPLGVRA